MSGDICVVIPTIRRPSVVRDYLANARRHGFDTDRLHFVLVTESFCDLKGMEAMLATEDVSGTVFDEPARTEWLADHGISEFSHLIPAASHAQTSFGLLYLWAEDFDVGVFIDDDTKPHAETDYFQTHLHNLGYTGDIEVVRSDKHWVNVLYQRDGDLYPRGYPYGAMGETVQTTTDPISSVVVSQGLWTNVPDLDAVRILNDGNLEGQSQTRTTATDFENDFVVAPGQYTTICSMNLAFRKEVVPAFYQLPMDDNPWDVGRFDDIWSGVILKRVADTQGDAILTGEPLCEHNKAPRSTFDDLADEAPGLELNEHLWEVVDDVGEDASSYSEAYERIATELAGGDFNQWRNGDFLNHVGEYMQDWIACLEQLRPAARVPAQD